jgi:hypothetical protein
MSASYRTPEAGTGAELWHLGRHAAGRQTAIWAAAIASDSACLGVSGQDIFTEWHSR